MRLQDELWHRVEVTWLSTGVRISVDSGVCAAEHKIASEQKHRLSIPLLHSISPQLLPPPPPSFLPFSSAFSWSANALRMTAIFGRGLSGCVRRLSVTWAGNASPPPVPDGKEGATVGCPGTLSEGKHVSPQLFPLDVCCRNRKH